jgi:hypothetical protein
MQFNHISPHSAFLAEHSYGLQIMARPATVDFGREGIQKVFRFAGGQAFLSAKRRSYG